jgi:hypothetical protein
MPRPFPHSPAISAAWELARSGNLRDAEEAARSMLGVLRRDPRHQDRTMNELREETKMKAAFAAFLVTMFASTTILATVEDDVKATFDRFVTAQNAHDTSAVRDLLSDSPGFVWITRGTPIWGRDAALKRYEMLYQGTWRLSPDTSALRVTVLSDTTAQLFVPILFNIGPQGQAATETLFLMNQTLVKTAVGWRIANILPIPVPPAAPMPSK